MSDNGTNQTRPLWHSTSKRQSREQLREDLVVDVCVVGAGIAGLCIAYELAGQGRRVCVLDDGPIGGGETGRSSAHLSSEIDDRYYRIEQIHGAEAARICYESHTAAIRWIAEVVTREEIACSFEPVDGYLFLPSGEGLDVLERELAAARRAGFHDAERVERAPIKNFDTGPCLRFPRQAQIDPLDFVLGLAEAAERRGGRIFTSTHVDRVEDRNGLRVQCAGDVSVRAQWVVVATNSPINDLVTMHTKQHAYRTYVVALPLVAGEVERALYWDTSQAPGDVNGPYHYVRIHHRAGNGRPGADEADVLLVGGEDHKTGQADDATARWARLETWARQRFPVTGGPQYRWSGQVLEPVDHVAFIGANPGGPKNVFIATGDSGMGLTHGAIAGMLIGDLIAERSNEWAKLYDPSRKTIATAFTFARENVNVAVQYTDWLGSGDVDSAEKIAAGSGALVRNGLRMLACYRDPAGQLHVRSAACPHLGGIVHWNSAEHTWDCPCHGSRFNPTGEVINGPASSGLSEAEIEQAEKEREHVS